MNKSVDVPDRSLQNPFFAERLGQRFSRPVAPCLRGLLGKSLPFGQLFQKGLTPDPTMIRQKLQESLSLRRGALFSLPMNLTALVSTAHYQTNCKIIKHP